MDNKMDIQCKASTCVGSTGCSICILQKALCRTCWISFHQKCGSPFASPESRASVPPSSAPPQVATSLTTKPPLSTPTPQEEGTKLTEVKQAPLLTWGGNVLTNPDRQGKFFVEWRVVDPSIAAGIGQLQEQVRKLFPQAVIRQSCATDNMHITMSEFSLSSADELNQAIAAIQQVEKELSSKPAAKLQVSELGNFDKRVLYAKVQSDSPTGGLVMWAAALNRSLKAAGLKPNPRPFVAHLTVAKATSVPLPAAVLGLRPGVLGTQMLTELHFCVKRLANEPTPPVVYTLRCTQ